MRRRQREDARATRRQRRDARLFRAQLVAAATGQPLPAWVQRSQRAARAQAELERWIKSGGKEGKPPPQFHVFSLDAPEARAVLDPLLISDDLWKIARYFDHLRGLRRRPRRHTTLRLAKWRPGARGLRAVQCGRCLGQIAAVYMACPSCKGFQWLIAIPMKIPMKPIQAKTG